MQDIPPVPQLNFIQLIIWLLLLVSFDSLVTFLHETINPEGPRFAAVGATFFLVLFSIVFVNRTIQFFKRSHPQPPAPPKP